MSEQNQNSLLPFKAERKLNQLFYITPQLKQNKDLQNKIIAWAEDMLEEAYHEWCELHDDVLDSAIKIHHSAHARKGAISRDKKYAPFREEFAKIQYEQFLKAYQNKERFSISSFVDWFLRHKAPNMKIPYVEQNQKNKLRQLAQQNKRVFEKCLNCR